MFGRPRARERAGRRAPLDVEQLAEPVPAEVRQLGDVGVQARDLDVVVPCLHRDEGDGLVGRPLHEQLHLAVLVGRAERGDRGGPDVRVVRPPMLAEALRPELHEPGGDVAQRVAVRHQHVHMASRAWCRRGTAATAKTPAGFFASASTSHRVAHVRRAGEQLPRCRSRSAPPGACPTGVSTLNRPPTFGGMSSARIPSARAMRAQRALLRVGDEDEPLPSPPRCPAPSRAAPRTTRYCAIVSAVPPDFEVTMNSAAPRSSRSSSAVIVGRVDVVEHVQPRVAAARRVVEHGSTAGGRSAVRSAIGPSAEPPMPSTTTSVDAAIRRRTWRASSARRLRLRARSSAGRGSRASPSRAAPRRAACAAANDPRAGGAPFGVGDAAGDGAGDHVGEVEADHGHRRRR